MLRRLLACLALCSGACAASDGGEAASADAAQEALEESAVSSQTDALLSDVVEISTHFTVGNAAAVAAAELQAFIASQLPCAAIEADAATLSIVYGGQAGDCTYHGHTFSGAQTLKIMRNAENEIAVHHDYHGFGDGHISIDGSADVVWSSTTQRRHITHAISYQILSGRFAGLGATASGDRTQTPLPDGIAEGMQIDGTRSWQDARGRFDLDIDGVQLRWLDPVPQAGVYELTTPAGASFSLTFGRKDSGSIQVSARSGTHAFVFIVSADGSVTR
jgi:hypothetical protein